MTAEDIMTVQEQLIKLKSATLRIEDAKELRALPTEGDLRILKDGAYIINAIIFVEDRKNRREKEILDATSKSRDAITACPQGTRQHNKNSR